MYKVKTYNKLTKKELERFWTTIEAEYHKDDSPAMVNMYDPAWRTEKNTLRYILEVESKFNPGDYYVLFDGTLPVASGGVYFSEWTSDIAMAGIRTWAHTEHRNKLLVAQYILPACKSWAIKNKCAAITLTFNDYNKNLIKVCLRTRAGESSTRISERTPDRLFYNGAIVVDFPLQINYTKQWLIYEKLDSNFDFNWEEIKWRDKIKIVHRKLG
jgi:hypothetical protein